MTRIHLELKEQVLLLRSGIPVTNFEIINVPYLMEGHFMRTIAVGPKYLPVLVLTHGYCSSSILYYPIIEGLTKHFRVILFDLPGMGGSSRPEFKVSNHLEAIDFFVSAFEAWRDLLQITDFILGGHSLGAYLSGCYASRFP